MNNYLLIFSLLLQCCSLINPVQAQDQRKLDSLVILLETTKDDTSTVVYLNEIAWEMMQSNPDTAIYIGNQSLALSEKLGWKRGTASCLGRLGVYYWNKADYPKALDYDFRALKMNEALGNRERVAANMSNIGIIYDKQGDYSKALYYYFKALKINEELGAKIGMASGLANIGIVYKEQLDNTKALYYFNKALKLDEELGNKSGIGTNFNNIGNLYKVLGEYAKAMDYYSKSLKIREELGSKKGIATSLSNMGSLYMLTGKFEQAEANLKKAIVIASALNIKKELREFEGNLYQLYDTTAQLAFKNKQFALAAEKYRLAMVHYKNSIAIKDTLFTLEKSKEITRKEMNYEFDKKEIATKAEHNKQLAVADVEIKKQKLIKNFFIGGLAMLLILSYFIYNNFRNASKLKLQNIRNKIASDLHDDVGSTLNSISIYSEVAKQKSPTVVDELEQIGDASRKIIEVMSDIVWTINPNNDSFESIISHMSSHAYTLLKAKNIEHLFKADENLNELKLSLETRRNFYLIFKEALNNLVKYSKATRASITLTFENGFITLTLRDNGIGFDVAQTSKGNGLLSMQARAKEMKAQLKIESSKENGTNIQLILKG